MTTTRLYHFAGKYLEVRARDEWSAQVVQRFIGDYLLTPVDGAEAEEVASVIEISGGELLPSAPRDLPSSEIFHGICRANGETLYLEIDDSLIVVGPPSSRFVRLWFGSTAKARHPLSVATVLSYATHAALRRRGLYELHAAGVVAPSGVGVLIIGASGSGKTTLTVRLAEGGWRYLSDDRLILGEDAESVVAWGLRRVFSVTERTLAACASTQLTAAAGTVAPGDPSKRHLEPRSAFPDGFARSCAPQALFFASIVAQRQSHVTALSQSEAMSRLIGHCPWTCYDAAMARDHLGALARLVRQSRAYRLRAGRELLDEPERATQLLLSQYRER